MISTNVFFPIYFYIDALYSDSSGDTYEDEQSCMHLLSLIRCFLLLLGHVSVSVKILLKINKNGRPIWLHLLVKHIMFYSGQNDKLVK